MKEGQNDDLHRESPSVLWRGKVLPVWEQATALVVARKRMPVARSWGERKLPYSRLRAFFISTSLVL